MFFNHSNKTSLYYTPNYQFYDQIYQKIRIKTFTQSPAAFQSLQSATRYFTTFAYTTCRNRYCQGSSRSGGASK